MAEAGIAMSSLFETLKGWSFPLAGIMFLAFLPTIFILLPMINGPMCRDEASAVAGLKKEGGEKAAPKSAKRAPPWRAFPWCLAPDWVWFCQGALVLALVAVPMISAICSTIPSLMLCQWLYQNVVWVRRGTDAAVSMKRKASRCVAERIMVDPRNHDYLPWMLVCSVVPPALLYLAWSRHRVHGFELWTMLVYHHFRLGPRFRFFAHHHVLIHKEGHDRKGFFVGPFRILNQFCGLWMGLFYGSLPFHYGTAHSKIHHRWHNDAGDVHTNIDLDRTSFASYVLYLPRFLLYWTGVSPLALFLKRGEYGLARTIASGMAYYYSAGLLLCYCVDWRFACGYWLVPLLESQTFLGMIGFIWHAFVEPEDPDNQYVNSVTILDGGDNIWNEDFHVVHHHFPSVHWSNAPAYFESNRAKYAEVTATIFKDCEEGNMIHWIFSQNWDKLAAHFVDLNGKLSHDEKKELILRRLRYQKGQGCERSDWGAWGSIVQRDWDAGKRD